MYSTVDFVVVVVHIFFYLCCRLSLFSLFGFQWWYCLGFGWISIERWRSLNETNTDTHTHTNKEAKRQSTRRQANACTYSLHISINNQNNRPRKQQNENMEQKEKLWLWNSQPTKQCTSKESKAFENPPNKMCDDQHQNKNRNNDGMAKYHCYQCWSSIILLSCVFLTFFGLQFQ